MPCNLAISSQGLMRFQDPRALTEKDISAIYGLKVRELIFLTFLYKRLVCIIEAFQFYYKISLLLFIADLVEPSYRN